MKKDAFFLHQGSDPSTGTSSPGFRLDPETIVKIFRHARPLGHHHDTAALNLGFGFLYYAVVRMLRPKYILVIGSGFGFSVVCLALGLKDNAAGELGFVDPSYSLLKHGPFKTVGGCDTWKNPDAVKDRFGIFGIDSIVAHYKMTSQEFFPQYHSFGLPKIDIAFVDGNHRFENVKYDFLSVLNHTKKNALIFLHDTNIYVRELLGNAGVKRWLTLIKEKPGEFELINFPYASGVAMVRVLKDDAWKAFVS